MTRGDEYPKLRVAAVQAAPVFLDREATIDKVDELTAEAVAGGAELVVFGESFVPAFPIWNGVLPPVDQHDLHERLFRNAVLVPGPDVQRLGDIAARHGVVLSVGITEKPAHSMGTLWNSNLLFDRNGRPVNHRRKLVATWYERLTWSAGDAHDLGVAGLDGLNVGALICGENTNTLARFTLLAQGERLHLASYPPSWPFDRREHGQEYDLTEAIKVRSVAHSFEGKVFTVVAATALDDDGVDQVAGGDGEIAKLLWANPTASLIVGPRGEILAGPLLGDTGILYADVDLGASIVPKQIHDIVGTYNRFDVFQLSVNTTRLEPVHLHEDESTR
ncbi:MAG: carbon-nitrogen hydrolase family protein [Streptosporangiales bacterium]|nr:carbon-nitrogen hydrolase family protein [Streptosporangiales bacterium]